MKTALIVVDMQNDFFQGGSLEVPQANEIISYINFIMEKNNYEKIIFTKDFHPANHISFASNNNKNIGETLFINGVSQLMWPDHCVQGTQGTEFHPELNTQFADCIIKKGTQAQYDSYSAFYDSEKHIKTNLSDFLKSNNIKTIEVCGLAMDYCVKHTCIDAIDEGFITYLHFNGTKAVNTNPNSQCNSIFEMVQKGINILA